MEPAFCSAARTTFVGVDHASVDEILIRLSLGIEPLAAVFRLPHLLHDDRTLKSGVLRNPPHRLLEGAAEDVDPELLVAVRLEIVKRLGAAQQRHPPARHDAFFDGRLRGVHGILDAGLFLLHFRFGRRAHLDDGHAAHQLGEPLLELLAIVIRGRIFDLRSDLFDAAFDGLFACPHLR